MFDLDWWPFCRRREGFSFNLVLLVAVLLLTAWLGVMWKEVEDKVVASPYRCQSAAKAAAFGCLAKGPYWSGAKFTLRQSSFEVGEIWTGHDYEVVRTGFFSHERKAGSRTYYNVEFSGTGLMQKHIRSPLEFRVDGQRTRLMLCDSGSTVRIDVNSEVHSHLIEIFDGPTKVVSLNVKANE